MRRLLPLLVALGLAGCDAGDRAAPGSDNRFQSPTLIVSTPSEGQQVVPAGKAGEVQVMFDLQGATLGRGAGSKVRYRLERRVYNRIKGEDELQPVTDWAVVAEPQRAVSLGKLQPSTEDDNYVLTGEVLDKDGKPWTREEAAAGDPAAKRTVNARARVVRTFTVHTSWK